VERLTKVGEEKLEQSVPKLAEKGGRGKTVYFNIEAEWSTLRGTKFRSLIVQGI
jgi:hypothetical protein